MLWIFFALAEMPLVVEMVAAYSHPRRTSYTFWAMYVLTHVPFELTCPTCMCPVLHATGPTCNRSYIAGPTGKWLLLVLLLNVNVHVDALFINL